MRSRWATVTSGWGAVCHYLHPLSGLSTIHEVATDPAVNLAYLAYYNAGFRVLAFGPKGLKEVGHFIGPHC